MNVLYKDSVAGNLRRLIGSRMPAARGIVLRERRREAVQGSGAHLPSHGRGSPTPKSPIGRTIQTGVSRRRAVVVLEQPAEPLLALNRPIATYRFNQPFHGYVAQPLVRTFF